MNVCMYRGVGCLILYYYYYYWNLYESKYFEEMNEAKHYESSGCRYQSLFVSINFLRQRTVKLNNQRSAHSR